MQTSHMTAHVARGIMLMAAMNNLRADNVPGSKQEQAWNAWRAGTSDKIAAFVTGEAYDLFDRVNSALTQGKI